MKRLSHFRFLRTSLRKRIILLVGLGMAALAGIIGVTALGGSRELAERALNERERLAQVLAEHLDYILRTNLVVLQDLALGVRTGLRGADTDLHPVKTALREAYLRSMFTEGVFLLDRTGNVVVREPQPTNRSEDDFASLACVRAALEAGRPEISGLIGGDKKRIYATVPIRDWSGELVGVAGGEMDPDTARFRSLLHPLSMGETTYVDLVDDHGIVLASTKTGRAFTESDHGKFLADLIQNKRSIVGTCHNCHQEDGLREREVMAFAPLKFAPWGVTIRQTEKEALASAFAMQQRLVLVGSLIILIALLFAWGVARSVTNPLMMLTRAAQRITHGNLDEVIPPVGEDEIGELARSFDRMRATLKHSLETIEEGNRELEVRVQQRTRELESLYEELRETEEMRRKLLKKVITAQEEERKRIARELHDETSQASAALLLAIEASGTKIPDEARQPLQRMKTLADRVLDSVHRLIFDLRPSMLDDLGLASALRFSAESRLEPMGLDLSFDVIGEERRLPPEIETTLFRIGQEAIANIARHAEAESVHITIEFREDEILLYIEDDGRGFEPQQFGKPIDDARGLGLLGMKERAALLNGTLTVHSQPGRGTRVSIRVPLTDDVMRPKTS